MPSRLFAKPLLIAAVIAALAGGFTSIYYLSAKYFFNQSSQAPSASFRQTVQPGLNELKLSTSLNTSVDRNGVRPTRGSPAIPAWIPLLLFAGTLSGGWWLREWYGRTTAQTAADKSLHNSLPASQPGGTPAKPAYGPGSHTRTENRADESSQLIEILAERDQQIENLNALIASLHAEYEQDHTRSSSGVPEAATDELIQLRKENASNSEIIQTLEELVAQNRENWLESDSTESAMEQEIAELNDNLNAAMAVIRAHADEPDHPDTSEPGDGPPSGKSASS